MNLGHIRATADGLLAMLEQPRRRPPALKMPREGWPSPSDRSRLAALSGTVVEQRSGAVIKQCIGCAFCALCTPPSGAEANLDSARVVWRDDDLVLFVVAGRPGVLLVPRQHVRCLSPSLIFSGALLASLRRAVRAVESWYHVGAAVNPVIEIPSAPGHVCYWVVPAAQGTGSATACKEHPDGLARWLADHLCQVQSV